MNDDYARSSEWERNELMAFSANCRQATEASLAQLNNSVNWAMTLTLAVSGFIIQSVLTADAPYTDFKLLVLIGLELLGFALLANFFARTAKSYLNVIRFSLVERQALRACFEISGSIYRLTHDTEEYYVEWGNPISIKRTIQKVLLEFGFVYWFLINIALTVYLCTMVSCNSATYVYVGVPLSWLIIILFEKWVFGLSAYAKNNHPHQDAMEKS